MQLGVLNKTGLYEKDQSVVGAATTDCKAAPKKSGEISRP